MFHGEIGKIVLYPFCVFFAHVHVGIFGCTSDIPISREDFQFSPALRLQDHVFLHIIKTDIPEIVDVFYEECRYIKHSGVHIVTGRTLVMEGILGFKLPEGKVNLFKFLYTLRFDIPHREFVELIFTYIKTTGAGLAEKNLAVILTAEIDLAVRAFKTNQLTHYPT